MNRMRAYHRPGQLVCFIPWGEPFQEAEDPPPWQMFAGALTRRGLEAITRDFEVCLEDWGV